MVYPLLPSPLLSSPTSLSPSPVVCACFSVVVSHGLNITPWTLHRDNQGMHLHQLPAWGVALTVLVCTVAGPGVPGDQLHPWPRPEMFFLS